MTDAEKIEELERENDGLSDKLKKEIEKNKSLVQGNIDLRNKLNLVEEENQQLRQAVEEITKANIGLQSELEEAEAKIQDLDESLAVYEHEAMNPSTGDYILELEEQIQILRKALKVVL